MAPDVKWKKDSKGEYFYHDKNGKRVYDSQRTRETPRTTYTGDQTISQYEASHAHGRSRRDKSYHSSGGHNQSAKHDRNAEAGNVEGADDPLQDLGNQLDGLAIEGGTGHESEYITASNTHSLTHSTTHDQQYEDFDTGNLSRDVIGSSIPAVTYSSTQGIYGTPIAAHSNAARSVPEEEYPGQASGSSPYTTTTIHVSGDNTHGQDIPETYTAEQPKEKSRYIRGTKGDKENLDPSYQKRKKDYKTFFRIGKVFSTLWTEPYDGPLNNQTQTFVSEVRYGGKVFSKIRRFVVVKEGNKCCTCLPVTSYQGKGPWKDQINLDQHGYIYSHRIPNPVNGINKQPLKVNLVESTAPLCDPSLINYGRVYTVETNVKVKEVGDLDSSSRATLRVYFRETFFGEGEGSEQLPPKDSQARDADFRGVGSGASTSTVGAGNQLLGGSYGQNLSHGYYPGNTSHSSYFPAAASHQSSAYAPASGPTYSTTQQNTYSAPSTGYPLAPAPFNDMNRNLNVQYSNWQQPGNNTYAQTGSSSGSSYAVDYGYRPPPSSNAFYPAAQSSGHGEYYDNNQYYQTNVDHTSSAVTETEHDIDLDSPSSRPPIHRPRRDSRRHR
ncbi:hypothetical protein B0O99DRAFT_690362 [Bisporella sp. PMI_857]|nr:hypothetical protein B0O99DRAFT_690362 [Bisporella sp. PMI_857]